MHDYDVHNTHTECRMFIFLMFSDPFNIFLSWKCYSYFKFYKIYGNPDNIEFSDMAEDLRLQKCEIKFYSIFFCTFIVVENELNAVVIMPSY